jgi:hypothetical protein
MWQSLQTIVAATLATAHQAGAMGQIQGGERWHGGRALQAPSQDWGMPGGLAKTAESTLATNTCPRTGWVARWPYPRMCSHGFEGSGWEWWHGLGRGGGLGGTD